MRAGSALLMTCMLLFLLCGIFQVQSARASSEDSVYEYSLSDLYLYGNASILSGNVIQLTPLEFHQYGSVWFPTSFNSTNGLEVSFDYWAGGGHDNWAEGADGIVFQFAPDPYSGSGDGSDTGIKTGSVGVELDSYYYEWDCDYGIEGKHIAIIKDVFYNHLAYKLDTRVDDETWHNVKIIYKDSVMQVYLDGSYILKSNVTLPGSVYLGASASTGNGYNKQWIKNIEIKAQDPILSLQTTSGEQINKIMNVNGSMMPYTTDIYNGLYVNLVIPDDILGAYSSGKLTIDLPAGFSFAFDSYVREKVDVSIKKGNTLKIPVYPLYVSGSISEVTFNVKFGTKVTPLTLPVEKYSNAGNVTCSQLTSSSSLTENINLSPVTDLINQLQNQYSFRVCKMCNALSQASYDSDYIQDALHNLGYTNVYLNNYYSSSMESVAMAIAVRSIIVNNKIQHHLISVIRGTVGMEIIGDLIVYDQLTSGKDHANFKQCAYNVKATPQNPEFQILQ